MEGVGRSPLPTGDWHKAGLEISIIEQASLCPTPKVMKLTNSMISKKKKQEITGLSILLLYRTKCKSKAVCQGLLNT